MLRKLSFALAILAVISVSVGCAQKPAAQPDTAAAQPDPAADKARMEADALAWFDHYAKADGEAMGNLYAEDALLMPPGAPAVTGRAAIKTFLGEDAAKTKAAGLSLKNASGTAPASMATPAGSAAPTPSSMRPGPRSTAAATSRCTDASTARGHTSGTRGTRIARRHRRPARRVRCSFRSRPEGLSFPSPLWGEGQGEGPERAKNVQAEKSKERVIIPSEARDLCPSRTASSAQGRLRGGSPAFRGILRRCAPQKVRLNELTENTAPCGSARTA